MSEATTTYVGQLHALADFLADRPDLVPEGTFYGVEVSLTVDSAEELALRLRDLGSCEKLNSEYFSGGRRQFGPHSVVVRAYKDQTCIKVPTGEVKTKTVTVTDPAEEVPNGARNVRTVTRTEVVYEIDAQVEEWVCPPSLLNPVSADHHD